MKTLHYSSGILKSYLHLFRAFRIYYLHVGRRATVQAGESITLKPGQYHRWNGEKGTGKILPFKDYKDYISF